MAIDPLHMPIFGDPVPEDPPPSVRVASSLLVIVVFVTLGYQSVTATAAAIYLLPTVFTVGFAFALRTGQQWARPAAAGSAGTAVLLAFINHDGTADLAVVAVTTVLLAVAVPISYRPAAHDYLDYAGNSRSG